MADQRYVAYYRVSTARQGESGLGLEAQRKAVEVYLAGNGAEIVEEFVEVESGKRNDRPELGKALAACRNGGKQRAILVIAKLDRLARNVAFIANLMDSGVEFVAVDNPHANRLMVHMLAAFAEHERDQISARTKAALAVAKDRGVKLGSPCPAKGGALGAAATRDKADRFAGNVLPILRELQGAGVDTYYGLAKALRMRGIPTARGGRWEATTVRNLLTR